MWFLSPPLFAFVRFWLLPPYAVVRIYIHHICQIQKVVLSFLIFITNNQQAHSSVYKKRSRNQSQSGLFSTARAVTGWVIRIAVHCCYTSTVSDKKSCGRPHGFRPTLPLSASEPIPSPSLRTSCMDTLSQYAILWRCWWLLLNRISAIGYTMVVLRSGFSTANWRFNWRTAGGKTTSE